MRENAVVGLSPCLYVKVHSRAYDARTCVSKVVDKNARVSDAEMTRFLRVNRERKREKYCSLSAHREQCRKFASMQI